METEAAVKGIELEHVYWEFLDQLTEEEAVKKIRNAGFDGILTAFHSFPINSKIHNILKKSKLPVVLVRADQNDWKRTDSQLSVLNEPALLPMAYKEYMIADTDAFATSGINTLNREFPLSKCLKCATLKMPTFVNA